MLEVGCDHGGSLEYVPTDVGTDIELTACELTDGVPVTGTGVFDDDAGTVHLELVLPGRRADATTTTVRPPRSPAPTSGEPVETSATHALTATGNTGAVPCC